MITLDKLTRLGDIRHEFATVVFRCHDARDGLFVKVERKAVSVQTRVGDLSFLTHLTGAVSQPDRDLAASLARMRDQRVAELNAAGCFPGVERRKKTANL